MISLDATYVSIGILAGTKRPRNLVNHAKAAEVTKTTVANVTTLDTEAETFAETMEDVIMAADMGDVTTTTVIRTEVVTDEMIAETMDAEMTTTDVMITTEDPAPAPQKIEDTTTKEVHLDHLKRITILQTNSTILEGVGLSVVKKQHTHTHTHTHKKNQFRLYIYIYISCIYIGRRTIFQFGINMISLFLCKMF